jgi:transcriptional regulator with XRE-family HTH domain
MEARARVEAAVQRERRGWPAWIGPGGLRRLRAERRLTQLQLAERAGVSKEAIHTYESGRKRPRRGTMRLLAGALGVPVVVLSGADAPLPLSA